MNEYCLKCMTPLFGETKCPHCGAEGPETPAPHVLIPGTILNDRYLLGEMIGQGGFGITYIGRDLMLDLRVAIKEYFPSGYANRNVEASNTVTVTNTAHNNYLENGKQRFLHEAQVLARFYGNPGVVDVRDFFETNNTAYIIMEYLDGEDLSKVLNRHCFAADDIFTRIMPVIDTLEKIHSQNIIHRDISPGNIMMLTDGTLKLMDFGSARLVMQDTEPSFSVMLKKGYAPPEQYRSKGSQGAWTDIYALCATLYKCITGINLEDLISIGTIGLIKGVSTFREDKNIKLEVTLLLRLIFYFYPRRLKIFYLN